MLWEIFLGVGLIATLASPFPWRSLFGQEQMGDGLLYWLLIAIFALSNNLLLRQQPQLARSQLQGLVIGGVILAISIFPQTINWRIDYTATSGQLLRDNILASTIFQNQQPIGLYSHRGHASFVLAGVAVITLIGWRWRWICTRDAVIASILIIPALLLTQTRAGILAFLVAGVYWFYQSGINKKVARFILCAVLVALLFIGAVSSTRQLEALNQFNFDNTTKVLKQLTSDRLYLWELSARGISQRPLLGWGMNGFGTAYPHIINSHWLKITRLGEFTFDYQNSDGQRKTQALITVKAHNLILDTILSVGVLGLVVYLVLLGFCLWLVIKSPYQGIETVAVAYIVFTFTWFECAQFTYIVWWALSFFGISSVCEKITP
ncbi:O-antigen ligase [Nostoc sp. PCC 7107]|uniref:O-antigen ligase family protein n=1 Tax=Nostoc sp. PCC 7107 TaxID=317936 RepID=UPI00029F2983|nr:O-antigen ligase family protein [Nostoc sp. PCC 7107]AFY41642.1 O-antigen polymerase [Nostoc sp. PCC 7107]